MAGGRITRELALLITGRDVSGSRAIRGVKREMNSLGGIGHKAGANVARNFEKALLIGGVGAVAALGYAVTQAMDRESAIAGVAKTVDGDISDIVEGLDKIASSSPVAFEELAAIAEAGGALGVAKEDVLGFVDTVSKLGVTTDLTSEAAADAIGHLRTTLGLAGDDFHELGDELVYLGNHGASTESQILSMAENIAGAADVMGASKEQVLGWAAALANTGEEAEAGGSSIQRFWLTSFKTVQKGGKGLEKMAKIAGMSAKEFKAAFGKDATGTLAKFMSKLGKLSKAKQLKILESLGFKDIRVQRALLKLLANTDNLTQSLKDAGAAEGAMNEEAGKRFGTTASMVATLKNNLQLAAATIGTELLPVLKDLSKEGIAWITSHKADIAQFGKDLAKGVREAVQWFQKLDWSAIGSTLSTVADVAKNIGQGFLNLPDWVKTAVITGWGLNKLTGGAVVDFGKLVVDQFAGRGSTPANPLFVSQIGGIPGGGGVGGVGAGAALLGAAGVVVLAKESGVVDQVKQGINSSIFGEQRASEIASFEERLARGELFQKYTTQAIRDLSADTRSEGALIRKTMHAGDSRSEAATIRAASISGNRAYSGGLIAAAAIKAKDLDVHVNPYVKVSTSYNVRIGARHVAHSAVATTVRGGAFDRGK